MIRTEHASPPKLQQATDIDSSQQAFVVTVHGTWPGRAGAKWARHDSILAQSVVRWFAGKGISATVVPFEWSGRNSFTARRRAATDLIDRLDRIHSELPHAEIYIIAHSHGGSVFAYAAKQRPDIIEAVNGFIALATPWVDVRPCGFAVSLRAMLSKFALYASFVLCLFILPWVIDRSVIDRLNIGYMVDQRVMIEKAIMLFVLSMAMAAALGVGFFALQRYVTRKLAGSAVAFEAKLATFADRVTTLQVALPKSVFLKPIADEAALALAWTSAMASLMQSASTTLFWFLQGIKDTWLRVPIWLQVIGGIVLTSLWCVGTVLILLDLGAETLEMPTLEAVRVLLLRLSHDLATPESLGDLTFQLVLFLFMFMPILSWITVSVFFLMLLALLIVGFLAAAGAGSLSPLTAIFFEFSVEAVPRGNHQLVLVDVRSKLSAPARLSRNPLNHSALYNSPGAIRAVIEAIAGFRAPEARS